MALTKIRGNLQVQDLSVTNSQIAFPDADNPDGILLAKIEDGNLLVKSDGSVAFTAPIAGVAPTQGSHLVTKDYVDAAAQGLDAKESVRAAALSNVTLSGTQTVDGVALNAGDRVLVAGQTNAVENGIYVVSAGGWTRAPDATTNATVTPGLFTFVEEGTTNHDTGWLLASDGPTTLGTTELPFVQFSAAGQISAGAGLTKSGNTLDVVSANGGIVVNANDIALTLDGSSLSVGANGVKIADGAAGQVLVADGAGAFRPVAFSGDVTIDENGVTTIGNGVLDGSNFANFSIPLIKLDNEDAAPGSVMLIGSEGVPYWVAASGDITVGDDGSFTINDDSVDGDALANNSVNGNKIVDGAVTESKLANNSVTADKLADGAVDTAAILDEAVDLEKLITLDPAKFIIGTASGNAQVTLSGDVTLSEAGVVTINPATVVRVADIVKGETPGGALDGSNTVFTLANTPKAGTVDVYVNGILQDAGGGNDYTIAGDTVTMAYVLTSADKIRVSYFK